MYRGVPFQIWHAALDLARGRLANGSVPKLPCVAVLDDVDVVQDLRAYAINVAVLLEFWGNLKPSLARDLLTTLDRLFGEDSDVLVHIMQESGTETLPGICVPELYPNPSMADNYLLAAYLRPKYWAAAKRYAEACLHVDIEALPISDQLYLLAIGKRDVRMDTAKRLMQEKSVHALAALTQELRDMADHRQFDFNRMNNIIGEMNRAKACLEGQCTR